jgi:hypothetical protein
MKIDLLTVPTDQFMMHSHVLNGEVIWLIQPQHAGARWTQANKHFRSSVWDSEGNLISASLPKFTNFLENPEHFPVPTSLKNCTVVDKIDGSLLSVTKHKGNFILRTRGTVDASKLDNGHELKFFREKYPEVFSYNPAFKTWNFSLIFEWTSPLQKIVIFYGDTPEFTLIGCVNHGDYSLETQDSLDKMAVWFGCPRPETYTFTTIEDMITNVNSLKGREGICVYSQGGQTVHKCKSHSYLVLHRFKSEATLENTLDLYFSYGKPSYQEFETKLVTTFDYECFGLVRGFASRICDAAKDVDNIVNGFKGFIEGTSPIICRNVKSIDGLCFARL